MNWDGGRRQIKRKKNRYDMWYDEKNIEREKMNGNKLLKSEWNEYHYSFKNIWIKFLFNCLQKNYNKD